MVTLALGETGTRAAMYICIFCAKHRCPAKGTGRSPALAPFPKLCSLARDYVSPNVSSAHLQG